MTQQLKSSLEKMGAENTEIYIYIYDPTKYQNSWRIPTNEELQVCRLRCIKPNIVTTIEGRRLE
jgi:hypothetical protein